MVTDYENKLFSKSRALTVDFFFKPIHKAWDIILYFLTVQREGLHALDTHAYVKLNALRKQIILSQMYTS